MLKATLSVTVALLAAAQIPAHAQTADPMSDPAYRAMLDFPRLVRGGSVEPHWLPDGHSFWYVDAAQTKIKVDPAANRVTPAGEVPADKQAADPGELAAPSSPLRAAVRNNNLELRSGDTATVITDDGAERYPWSIAGGLWSADSKRLLALHLDERKVHFIPVVHWLKAQHEEIAYPLAYPAAGEPQVETELAVFEGLGSTRRRTAISIGGEPGQTVYPLRFSSDGSEVLFLRMNRAMTQLDLMAASAATGQSRVVLTERSKTFIEGLAFSRYSPVYYAVGDGARFIWRSERSGWSALYLYDGNGRLVRPLTSGPMPVETVKAIDDKGDWIYYTAHGDRDRPYDEQLYRVDLDGKRATRLTPATGVHDIVFSPDNQYFLDTHSTPERPPAVDLRRADGALIRALSTADIGALTALHWHPPEEFKAKAVDGTTDIYGAIYTPHDLDPSRRYPVIDLEYPGNYTHVAPHKFVTDSPLLFGNVTVGIGDDAQSLTQLGFVVVVVDGRGTTGRSKAFQDFTYQNIGMFEIPDHIAAIKQVAARRPYMDLTRVGITGWSWGGYYALRGMLTAPDFYKVGVSGAPVVDLQAARAPIEPYMGMPQDHPEAYERASNIPLAGKLAGKLMITIGTSDTNVTFNHSMRMADALIKADKHFDLMVMPEETHDLTPHGRAYYVETRNRYFLDYLGRPVK